MEYLIKLLLFIFLLVSLYYVALSYHKKGRKISWFAIVVYSILFSFYSAYIGANPIVNDRANYYAHFLSGRDISQDSIAVNYIFHELRKISNNQNILPITFCGISVIIALTAYKYYKNITPKTLLFVFSSLFTIYTFVAYKQAPANALAALSFAIYFSNLKYIPKLFLLSCIIIATILFHEVGYILVVVYFCLFLWGNKYIRNIGFFLLPIFMIIFPFAYRLILGNIGIVSESLESQAAHYVDGGGEGMGAFPAFKGLYFYIITYIGIKYRSRLLKRISDYDRYLFLSIIASFVFMATAINYWYFRFSMLFYFPVFYFAHNIYLHALKWKRSVFNWYNLAYFYCLAMTIKQLIQYFYRYGGI